MLLSVGFLLLMLQTQNVVLTGDQCIPNRQTFSLAQDRNGNNVCAPVLSTAIITKVQSRSECGLSCMKVRPCGSYTLFVDTMKCVVYSNNTPSYFELGVPHCWSYVDDRFPTVYDCINFPNRNLIAVGNEYMADFFVDGKSQLPNEGLGDREETGAIIIPGLARNIAVKVSNQASWSIMLLASTTDQSFLSTGSDWKCAVGVGDSFWMLPRYDDSGWGVCSNCALNGQQVSCSTGVPFFSNISSSAHWIYYKGQGPVETAVYFRLTLSNKCTAVVG